MNARQFHLTLCLVTDPLRYKQQLKKHNLSHWSFTFHQISSVSSARWCQRCLASPEAIFEVHVCSSRRGMRFLFIPPSSPLLHPHPCCVSISHATCLLSTTQASQYPTKTYSIQKKVSLPVVTLWCQAESLVILKAYVCKTEADEEVVVFLSWSKVLDGQKFGPDDRTTWMKS